MVAAKLWAVRLRLYPHDSNNKPRWRGANIRIMNKTKITCMTLAALWLLYAIYSMATNWGGFSLPALCLTSIGLAAIYIAYGILKGEY